MFVMQSLAACVKFVWLGSQLDPNLNYKLRYSIQVAKLNFEGVIQSFHSTETCFPWERPTESVPKQAVQLEKEN